MEIPQELESVKSNLKQYETQIHQLVYRLEYFRTADSRFDTFSDMFYRIDSELRDVLQKLSELQPRFGELFIAIEQRSAYKKDFDLYPGDRVRITMPAQYPFPAGWAEGSVISAHWYSDNGWYIEFEKDNVSPGWYKGYGYWKQDVDGGTVEKI